MNTHEYADLFPMMTQDEIGLLSQDIANNGLSEAIIIFEYMILDGRNRHKACEMAGVTPRYEDYDGDDALGFVISHNLRRRHLNESQRAMIAARVATLRRGEFAGNQHSSHSPIGEHQLLPHKDRSQAAKELNISSSSLDRARRLQRDAIPEIQEMVNKGELSVNAGVSISKLSEDDQKMATEKGVEGVKSALKKETPGETPKPTPPNKIVITENNGMAIFASSKSVMDRLNPKDTQWEQSLKEMISYCEGRLNNKQ